LGWVGSLVLIGFVPEEQAVRIDTITEKRRVVINV
jgi:hypothetical protein